MVSYLNCSPPRAIEQDLYCDCTRIQDRRLARPVGPPRTGSGRPSPCRTGRTCRPRRRGPPPDSGWRCPGTRACRQPVADPDGVADFGDVEDLRGCHISCCRFDPCAYQNCRKCISSTSWSWTSFTSLNLSTLPPNSPANNGGHFLPSWANSPSISRTTS